MQKNKSSLKQALNHCRVALATKQMFTLGDCLKYLGLDSNAISKMPPEILLSIRDFNAIVVPQIEKLSTQNNSTQNNPLSILYEAYKDSSLKEVKSIYDKHPLDNTGWILNERNPNQKAILYPAQVKAAKDLAYRLFIENRRGVLLRASVGVGKTFMYGQLIRWAYDSPTQPIKDSISLWPVLVITKASVVEQTRRVMANQFGLDTIRQVTVLHYDALRSSTGLELMIELKKVIRGGEYYEEFHWRPFVRPRLIIIDECQAAKNESSQQSEIIQSLDDIAQDTINPIKIVASSATPFTRISEAKYFCINAGIPYKII